MELPLRRILPSWFLIANDYGALGVQIFFVLSGFVIAHSLRNNPLTRQSIGNFILRRQVRLDPPYWAMIVISLCLHRIELFLPLATPPMPSVGTVLLNFFYLQNLTGVEEVVGVAWTLCLEIQFYIVFIALLALGSLVRSAELKRKLSIGLIFASGTLSLIIVHFTLQPAWFFQYWFYFAAGVLCYWSFSKFASPAVFWAFVALFGLGLGVSFFTGVTHRSYSAPAMTVGLLTALSIYLTGVKGRLTQLWNYPVLQYLGRISYSLYLSHLTVLIIVLRGAYKLTGENEKMALVWFVISGIVCIGVAHLFYMLVERPSIALGARLRRTSERGGEASTQTPVTQTA